MVHFLNINMYYLNVNMYFLNVNNVWCTFSMLTDPRFEAEVNCDCARTLITRQRALVDSVAHASCEEVQIQNLKVLGTMSFFKKDN